MDNVSIEEKYHFDTLGFLLLKEVLNQSEIKSLTSSFNSIRNNEEIDSIHLNKKEMIPDDVNHASRVFIDDHYVRINHLDKLVLFLNRGLELHLHLNNVELIHL